MLGKASEIKTITFESDSKFYLWEKINAWLGNNPKADILDIKYSFSMNGDERADAALIIYKEPTT